MQEPEILFIGDVGIFEKLKKVAKRKIVEIKEQKVKGCMFEILRSEAEFDTAIEVKKNINIENEKVMMKKKRRRNNRKMKMNHKEDQCGICGEDVVDEI